VHGVMHQRDRQEKPSYQLPVLLSVAFMTIVERKQLAAHQRRVGPTVVGYYGIAQPFADALKLILKETVIPSQSNKVLFYLAPVSSFIFSYLGWAIIPFGQGLTLFDFSLGIFIFILLIDLMSIYFSDYLIEKLIN
jgi:NADH-ubiquinone oxidoreductase chain 1